MRIETLLADEVIPFEGIRLIDSLNLVDHIFPRLHLLRGLFWHSSGRTFLDDRLVHFLWLDGVHFEREDEGVW